MKISIDKPTCHIFIALMDYRVDHNPEAESDYGFGYFKLDDTLAYYLNQFHDNWEKGKRYFPGVLINIPEIFLINRNFIYKQVYEKENPDYTGIKLDSLNFLETMPQLDYPTMIKGTGNIIASRNNFTIQCEDIVDRGISLTIYKSSVISYWKINHILKRKNPI